MSAEQVSKEESDGLISEEAGRRIAAKVDAMRASYEQPTAEGKVASSRIDMLISYATQTSKTWLCVDVVKALRELQELRRNVARYENGRVVLMAELDNAKQLAMRQANEIRKLQRSRS